MIKIDVEQMRKQFLTNDMARDKGLNEPENLVKIKNLSYGTQGIENQFDIYYPKGTTAPLPTIISIHGGGFFYGSKEIYRFYTMFLATQGFTVINCNYRLAPENPYPAPLEDINSLMQWLLQYGENYFVDMDQLFLVGDSAGAQLTEQYATMVSNPAYAKQFDFAVAPVQLRAIALNCGVYFIGKQAAVNQDFPHYFGEKVSEATTAQFPVERFMTDKFPPAFIMTATHDFLKDMAKPLANILQTKNIPTDYHLYANFDDTELGHVFHLDQKSSIAKECNLATIEFFKKFLE